MPIVFSLPMWCCGVLFSLFCLLLLSFYFFLFLGWGGWVFGGAHFTSVRAQFRLRFACVLIVDHKLYHSRIGVRRDRRRPLHRRCRFRPSAGAGSPRLFGGGGGGGARTAGDRRHRQRRPLLRLVGGHPVGGDRSASGRRSLRRSPAIDARVVLQRYLQTDTRTNTERVSFRIPPS